MTHKGSPDYYYYYYYYLGRFAKHRGPHEVWLLHLGGCFLNAIFAGRCSFAYTAAGEFVYASVSCERTRRSCVRIVAIVLGGPLFVCRHESHHRVAPGAGVQTASAPQSRSLALASTVFSMVFCQQVGRRGGMLCNSHSLPFLRFRSILICPGRASYAV